MRFGVVFKISARHAQVERAASSGLMTRRSGAYAPDLAAKLGEPPACFGGSCRRDLHQFKTTARIASPW
jgi:hypothetical protein